MKGFMKDNTGYHIKNLLIGSEGTLGIITECKIKLQRKNNSINGMILSLNNIDKLNDLITYSHDYLGNIIYAYELIDKKCLDLHKKHGKELPINYDNFNILIETQSNDDKYHQDILDNFFQICMDNEIISDGFLAYNDTQLKNLWILRESITENLSKENKFLYKFDISIKLNDLIKLKKSLTEYDHYIFGHIFDENIHLNILTDKQDDIIEDKIYKLVSDLNGSISAEHGIGIMKKKYLELYDSKNQLNLLKKIKKIFDPHNILNPGVLL